MTDERRTWVKRILGLLLLLGIIYLLSNIFQSNQKLGIFLLIGIGLGYIESHSEVGIASGYVDFFVTGSRSRLYGLLLLFGLGSLVALIIHAVAASKGAVPSYLATDSQAIIPGTGAVTPVNFGLILGSFLFGVGLTLNKGCGMGTLRNIGLGKMRYLITFLFILIGTIPGQWLKYQLNQSPIHQYSLQVYFPDVFGYVGSAIFIFILFTVLILWGVVVERTIRKRSGFYNVKTTPSPEMKIQKNKNPILHFILHKKWSRLVSVILITILLAVALLFTGEHLAVTSSYLYPAVALFQRMGISFHDPAFQEPAQVVQAGLFNHPVVLQNAGIILGALLLGLLSSEFTFSWEMNLKEAAIFSLSGFLMGFGAILASGCIVGALYSGVVNLSLSGWVVFLSMSVGIWLTVKTMNGKIRTITKLSY